DLEANVAHHRGHDGVSLQAPLALHLPGTHQHDRIAVDNLSAFVDEYRAVSIAVIGNADRISTVDNRAGELLRRRGSGVQIDVATIRLASDAAHLEAKLLEEPRRDGGRG